jgi:uncharacterized protein (TIGR04255 family)
MIPPAQLRIDLSERFPHLARAPIVEAVIHWQARAGVALEPEAFRVRLIKSLPDYGQSVPIRMFQMHAPLGGEAAPPDLTPHESWAGWRFTSHDKRQIAQFKPDGFVFSRLAPYDGWEIFAAEARRLWAIFVEVAAPSEVQRLGVRFINRIAPVSIEGIGSVLTRPPIRLGTFGLPVREFLYQSVHEVPGHPYRLNVVDTIQSEMLPQIAGPALILDIDAYTTRPTDIGDAQLDEHLDRLRWLKNKAYFSLIRKSAMKRFEKDKG